MLTLIAGNLLIWIALGIMWSKFRAEIADLSRQLSDFGK